MVKPSNDVVGHLVQLSRRRQERDLKEGGKRGLYFDNDAADRVVKFFTLLRHSKGEWAGQRFDLAPWQEHEIIRPLFGWKRADGTRRFRTAYISVARKNGKSTLAAGVGLYLTCADGEAGAEVYSAATKRDQARITHSEATRMVKASASLGRWVQTFRDNISIVRTGSKYEPLGADADTSDGLNVHGAILDEIHAHKTRNLWDVIETGTGARRQPLLFGITTAGYNRNTICWELDDRAVKILEGALQDDSVFVYIARIDKGDDWKDRSCWIKGNPNLGISVKLDTLLEQCQKARESPAFQNTFRRLRLNEWTQQADRFLDMEHWLACTGTVDESELVGRECYGGLDLSSTADFTSACWVFPFDREGRKTYKALWRFWIPEEKLAERIKRESIPYDLWVQRGYIKTTPGNVVDYDFVRAGLDEDRKKFRIRELGVDPWNAREIIAKLHGTGWEQFKEGPVPKYNVVFEFRQGFKSMWEPTKKLLGVVLDRQLEHGNNPVATWMASNLTVSQDPAGCLKPDKAKSTEKIDGMVALIMALGRAVVSSSKGSVYESRGILTI